jgi:iron complex transport system substrate-binding protein
MRWSALLLVIGLMFACGALAWLALRLLPGPAPAVETRADAPRRIVSLAPAITETLFAIGAGGQVVGVSDYCNQPPEAARLRHCGTALTPNFETISAVGPDLILTEKSVNTPDAQLRAIGRSELIPWLTTADVVAGVRRIGALAGRASSADELALRIEATLARRPGPGAPRVLVVLGGGTGQLKEIWYLRSDSIHGDALLAAGGRNAVEAPARGAPVLSLEGAIALDPDIVLVIWPVEVSEQRRREVRDSFEPLRLRALRENRFEVLGGPHLYSTGPGVLKLVEALEAVITRLKAGSGD